MTELETLKKRADMLGVTYSKNIGVDTLKKRIESSLSNEAEEREEKSVEEEALIAKHALRMKAKELVRVIVTCSNPNKLKYDGEIFTVSNNLVGTIKKFVPFNNEKGWHIERMLLNVIRERECQIFVPTTDDKGRKIVKSKLIPEFIVTELPPLTADEMSALAKKQLATQVTDE